MFQLTPMISLLFLILIFLYYYYYLNPGHFFSYLVWRRSQLLEPVTKWFQDISSEAQNSKKKKKKKRETGTKRNFKLGYKYF